jgi:hypothetical protein
VRKRGGRKRALGTRASMAVPQGRNLRWSLDFVADTLVSGRRFRVALGLVLATFAKPSTNFTNSLPSFFAFVSGLWLKTDAGPRNGASQKWHGVKQR